MARATANDGRVHDVVVVASKVLHEKQLTPRDLDDLRWAKSLIKKAESTEVVFRMPSAMNLSNSGSVVSAIRRVAGPDDEQNAPEIQSSERELKLMLKGIDNVIRGAEAPENLRAMDGLQTLFSIISRMALANEVQQQRNQSAQNLNWQLATTTLAS